MGRYILSRLTGLIAVLLAASFVTFALMKMVPGGPFDAWALQNAQMIPEELVEMMEKKYGYDKPFFEQYMLFLKNAIRFDFGNSLYSSGRSVNEIIAQHWPYTLQLGLLTLAFSSVVGLTLGIAAAMKQGSFIDHFGTGLTLLFQAIPGFVFAVLMQYILSVKLHWVPTGGWETPKHWIMPVLANSLGPILILQRYTRSAVADVIRSDYVRTARAKGMSERRVTLIHVFKNALTPVVTVAGPMMAGLITGSFFIERIFRVPGLGWYFGSAIANRDHVLIMASTVMYTAILSITYLLTDLVYALIDPRVAYVKER
jgi:oligopeptide transport system permease protein